jgi:hypothetical protein
MVVTVQNDASANETRSIGKYANLDALSGLHRDSDLVFQV